MSNGMGVIQSSGKVALTMQSMVNHAKAGNTQQARDYKLYIDNMLKGMQLADRNKENARLYRDLQSAKSDLEAASKRINALTLKNIGDKASHGVALAEEKYGHKAKQLEAAYGFNTKLNNQELENLIAQTEKDLKYHKNLLTMEDVYQDEARDVEVKNKIALLEKDLELAKAKLNPENMTAEDARTRLETATRYVEEFKKEVSEISAKLGRAATENDLRIAWGALYQDKMNNYTNSLAIMRKPDGLGSPTEERAWSDRRTDDVSARYTEGANRSEQIASDAFKRSQEYDKQAEGYEKDAAAIKPPSLSPFQQQAFGEINKASARGSTEIAPDELPPDPRITKYTKDGYDIDLLHSTDTHSDQMSSYRPVAPLFEKKAKEYEGKAEESRSRAKIQRQISLAAQDDADQKRQTSEDVLLGSVEGGDKLVEERIGKRKTLEQTAKEKMSEEFSDLVNLIEIGASPQDISAKISKITSESSDPVKTAAGFVRLANLHKNTPDLYKTFIDAAMRVAGAAGMDPTKATSRSGKSGTTTVPGASTATEDSLETWRKTLANARYTKDVSAGALLTSHPVLRDVFTQIIPQYKQRNWWIIPDKDVGGKMTPQSAHKGIQAIISAAINKQLTPTQMDDMLSDISGVALLVPGDSFSGGDNVSDADRFAMTIKNIMKFGDGSIWNEMKNAVAQLALNEKGLGEEVSIKDRWTFPDGTTIDKWVPPSIKKLMPSGTTTPGAGTTQSPDPSRPSPSPEYAPQKNKEMIRWNLKTHSFEKVSAESVEYDGKKVSRVKIDGKWEDVDTPYFDKEKGHSIRVPSVSRGITTSLAMQKGTRVVFEGKEYKFEEVGSDWLGGKHLKLLDSDGNIRKISMDDAKNKLYFPKDATIEEMNAAVSGEPPPSAGRPKQQKRQAGSSDPLKPPSEKEKKGKEPVEGSKASTMTWEQTKSGKTRVKGEFFNATVVNLIPEGAKRRGGKSGIWDGDTLYGVTVEIPDTNLDGRIGKEDYMEVNGKRVPIPETWWKRKVQGRKSTAENNNVYMSGIPVRLAGYDAWELTSTTEDKDGREARAALIRMFKQGWVDAKEKDRFIFKVRAVGAPFNHGKSSKSWHQNPYVDRYGRIVTDVYIVVGGTQKKVAELEFKNPVPSLIEQGHGQHWRP